MKRLSLSEVRVRRLKRSLSRLTFVLIVLVIAIWFGWLVADTLADLTSQE